MTRVRTLDIVMDAILYGHKWAVDRSITKTYVKDVTEGLQAFMRDLKALGAIINWVMYRSTMALYSPPALGPTRNCRCMD